MNIFCISNFHLQERRDRDRRNRIGSSIHTDKYSGLIITQGFRCLVLERKKRNKGHVYYIDIATNTVFYFRLAQFLTFPFQQLDSLTHRDYFSTDYIMFASRSAPLFWNVGVTKSPVCSFSGRKYTCMQNPPYNNKSRASFPWSWVGQWHCPLTLSLISKDKPKTKL